MKTTFVINGNSMHYAMLKKKKMTMKMTKKKKKMTTTIMMMTARVLMWICVLSWRNVYNREFAT